MDSLPDAVLVGSSVLVAFAVIAATGGWRVAEKLRVLDRSTLALALVGGGARLLGRSASRPGSARHQRTFRCRLALPLHDVVGRSRRARRVSGRQRASGAHGHRGRRVLGGGYRRPACELGVSELLLALREVPRPRSADAGRGPTVRNRNARSRRGRATTGHTLRRHARSWRGSDTRGARRPSEAFVGHGCRGLGMEAERLSRRHHGPLRRELAVDGRTSGRGARLGCPAARPTGDDRPVRVRASHWGLWRPALRDAGRPRRARRS